MIQPGRKYSATDSYRYGFNGKENDNEVKGEGNSQDYGLRIYDPRLGRFLSVDPLTEDYPELTPYQFASNTPIWAIDLDGAEALVLTPSGGGTQTGTTAIGNSTKNWWNSPASLTEKNSHLAVMNYTRSGGESLTVADLKALTKGEHLMFLIGSVQLNNNTHGRLPPNKRNIALPKVSVQPQKPKASLDPTTGTIKTAPANSESVKTVTVTRVQTKHNLSQRISVNEAGDISIVGNTKLYITIDDKNHVQYYYNKKGGSEGGASVVSFQVKKEVADEIRKMAVPQAKARSNPDKPEIADPTKSKSAFGLPANYIEKLEKGAIKGTGKVETP